MTRILFSLLTLASLLLPIQGWASDYCFNFRSSSGYVTDPSGCSPVLSTDIYPHTFNFVGGASVTGGWVAFTSGNDRDRNTGTPRLAGINYIDSVAVRVFQIDLDAAESKDIVYALGDFSAAHGPMTMVLKDNGTIFDTALAVTSGGADHYIDASHTDRTSSADWVTNGSVAKVTRSMSSTAFTFELSSIIAGDASISHFRITSSATTTPTAQFIRRVQ